MRIVFGHVLVAYATLVAPLLSYRKVRQLGRAGTVGAGDDAGVWKVGDGWKNCAPDTDPISAG